jgi:hypothetical protein
VYHDTRFLVVYHGTRFLVATTESLGSWLRIHYVPT